jgi:hypothetical protein
VREERRDFRRGWCFVALSTTALGVHAVKICWFEVNVDGLGYSLVDRCYYWRNSYCGD